MRHSALVSFLICLFFMSCGHGGDATDEPALVASRIMAAPKQTSNPFDDPRISPLLSWDSKLLKNFETLTPLPTRSATSQGIDILFQDFTGSDGSTLEIRHTKTGWLLYQPLSGSDGMNDQQVIDKVKALVLQHVGTIAGAANLRRDGSINGFRLFRGDSSIPWDPSGLIPFTPGGPKDGMIALQGNNAIGIFLAKARGDFPDRPQGLDVVNILASTGWFANAGGRETKSGRPAPQP